MRSPSSADTGVIGRILRPEEEKDFRTDSTQLVYFLEIRGLRRFPDKPNTMLKQPSMNAHCSKRLKRRLLTPILTYTPFGAMRACREVCPKHRNIRRESCGCDAPGQDPQSSRRMATDTVLFPDAAATAHPKRGLASGAGVSPSTLHTGSGGDALTNFCQQP
jgi:hypothetical protein